MGRIKDDTSWELRESLLKDGELEEYRQLARLRFSEADVVKTVLAILVPLAALITSATLDIKLDGDPGDLDSLFELVATALVFTGWYPGFATWKASARRAHEKRKSEVRAFANRIYYRGRLGYRGGGRREPTTREYQRAWYGSNNQDLGWQDRTVAESYGMSADEYRNNVLEAD